MTLLEIAEYLSATQQTLYDHNGRCVLRDVADYGDFHKQITIIQSFKELFETSFYTMKPDDNVTFILLVHECISNK
jgi:hypothetical protein